MVEVEHRDRVAVLYLALAYAVAECAFGLALVLATAGAGRIPPTWLDAVRTVGRADVGAFTTRWLLHATAGLQRATKFLVGLGLVAEGLVRSVLLIGVLRGSRGMTVAAAVVFGAGAIGGMLVAGLNPSVAQLCTLILNVLVAAVIAVEARRRYSGVHTGSRFRL